MKVEVTKFNTRSLSTPIFATKNQDFVQKKKKTEIDNNLKR